MKSKRKRRGTHGSEASPTEEELVRRFRDFLADRGLKFTRPRQAILLTFFDCEGHVSAEELFQRVREQHPEIGFATVHRTLKVLVEAGFAEEHTFGGRFRRYERSLRKEHHDHLICSDCGHIIEFEEPRIEALQEEVARRFGFRIEDHRLELFGRCERLARGETCPDQEARAGRRRD